MHGRHHRRAHHALHPEEGRGAVRRQARLRRAGRGGRRTFPARAAARRRPLRGPLDPGPGDGDERHQRRAIHGPFGTLRPAPGRGRLFGDEHRVRPVPDHDHPGRRRPVVLSLAGAAGRDPAAAVRHPARQPRSRDAGVPEARRADHDPLLRLRPRQYARPAPRGRGGADGGGARRPGGGGHRPCADPDGPSDRRKRRGRNRGRFERRQFRRRAGPGRRRQPRLRRRSQAGHGSGGGFDHRHGHPDAPGHRLVGEAGGRRHPGRS